MVELKQGIGAHPKESELADYLSKALSGKDRMAVEEHIASCDECLERVVSAHESVKLFKKRKANIVKKFNIYLILAIISFILSFAAPQYFLQFLTATLLLGIKWVVDSKTTKMLVMIHDAWKKGGAEDASRILSSLDKSPRSRI